MFCLSDVSYAPSENKELSQSPVLPETTKDQEIQDAADIIFLVGGEKIYAGKCVLTLLSPVFKAMFRSDFKEKHAKEIPSNKAIIYCNESKSENISYKTNKVMARASLHLASALI